jgi:hypothetical protein
MIDQNALTALASIEELRGEIDTAKVKLAELEAMPVPLAEAEAALDAALARLSERGADALTITSLTRPRLRPEFAPDLALGDVTALLIGLHHKEIRKLITDKLKDTYTGRTVLPKAEAEALAETIRHELLGLELEEEAAIRYAEVAGWPIDRRADADPRAVLALIEV